jgi:branched-chain amino acid aminotransferase
MNLDLLKGYYVDSSGKNGFYNRKELKENDLDPDPFFCHNQHYARGAFEGIRAIWDNKKEQLYFLTPKEHVNRLVKSCDFLRLKGIDFSKTLDVLPELIHRNIESGFLDPRKGCYLRPLVYKDKKYNSDKEQEHGLGVYSQKHQTVMTISLFPWGKYLEGNPDIRVYEKGIASVLRTHKCTANYGFGGLAKDIALDEGYDEALITDISKERNVLEGGGENVFIARDNKVITPGVDQDILPGTKRNILIQMLNNLGIEVEERKIPLKEFMEADAAIFTGTAAGVVGIASVYNPLVGGKPEEFNLEHCVGGIITVRELEREYERLIMGENVNPVQLGLQERIRTPIKWRM